MWLAIGIVSVPLFAFGLWSLVVESRRFIRARNAGELLRLPVVARQELTFVNAGPVVLQFESRAVHSALRGLEFQLLENASGRELRGRRVWFTSLRRARSGARNVEYLRYDVESPGLHRLEITGLDERHLEPQHAVVFARPLDRAVARFVIALTLSLVAIVAGAVASALALSESANVLQRAVWLLEGGRIGEGRALPRYQADLESWREVRIRTVQLSLRVPDNWREEVRTDARLILRSLTENVTETLRIQCVPVPDRSTPEAWVQKTFRTAQEMFERGDIEGYEERRLDDVDGVLLIGAASAPHLSWIGFRQVGSQLLRIELDFSAEFREGASSASEAHFSLVLDTVHFGGD
ncbi:MAG: hypothetical protein ACKVX7_03880 [Planctomycetota bacterium]